MIAFLFYFSILRKKTVYSKKFQEELDKKTSFLSAIYHRDIFSTLYFIRIFKVLSMVSSGRDGQIVTQFLEFFGSRTVRGSARNNSVQALKGFLREFKKDKFQANIAIDGSKGPPLKPKPGILEISRFTKKPIFSVGVAYSSCWTLKKTWDQTRIPKPFSKVIFYFDIAHETVSKEQNPRDPKLLDGFENALMANYKKALVILEQNG